MYGVSKKQKISGSYKYLVIVVVGFVFLAAILPLRKKSDEGAKMPRKALPTPTPILVEGAKGEVSWESSDGSHTLILKKVEKEKGLVSYSLLIKNEQQKESSLIFTRMLADGGGLSIPFNAWSPDNKYFYVNQRSSDGVRALVFKTTGENFSQGQEYGDVREYFEAKKLEYTFNEVTGWAAPTLLLVNTRKGENEKGPSFWFDIESKSFIRLSTSF